jgi:hypothetical protein
MYAYLSANVSQRRLAHVLSIPGHLQLACRRGPGDLPEELLCVNVCIYGAEYHRYVDPPKVRNTHTKVYIVYFAYIHPARKKWKDLIMQQLDDFNCNGLADRAERFLVTLQIDAESNEDQKAASLAQEAVTAVRHIMPNASIKLNLQNHFEYAGIRCVCMCVCVPVYVIRPRAYVICHMSYVICHMSYVICHMSYVICHSLK